MKVDIPEESGNRSRTRESNPELTTLFFPPG
jgi:hypothetical protein